jgi:beta-carotene 15,15'-dioxygenase
MTATRISWVWSLAAICIAMIFGIAQHSFGITMPMDIQFVIVAFSIAILGLSHGGLDHLVAKKIWLSRAERNVSAISNRQFMIIFLLSYCVLAALVVLLWGQWPIVSLIVFLALTAFHFGDDMRLARLTTSSIVACALGSIVIVLPWTFHTSDVAIIFAWLTDSTMLDWTTSRLKIAQAISLLLVTISVLTIFRSRQHVAIDHIEFLAIATLFIFAPPLVAFAMFFSFLHANQHMLSLALYFYPSATPSNAYWRVFKSSLPLTFIAILVAAMAWYFTPLRHAAHATESVAQIIFIGLAALTMPHMLLVAFWSKQQRMSAMDKPAYDAVK